MSLSGRVIQVLGGGGVMANVGWDVCSGGPVSERECDDIWGCKGGGCVC